MEIDKEQSIVLQMALEFYVRLGLGQFSQIAHRINLLQGVRLNPEKLQKITDLCEEMESTLFEDGDPWRLVDPETSIYTLIAAFLDAQITGDAAGCKWTKKQIETHRKQNKEVIP